MPRVTQSMLGAADKCLRSLQYQLERPAWVKRVAGAERAVGTGYHAGLELYYRERIGAPGLLPDLEAMITEGVRVFDVSTEIDLYDNTPVEVFKWSDRVPDAAKAHDLIAQMLTFYVAEGWVYPPDWTVLDVEADYTVRFPAPYDHHEGKLGADLILIDPAGWIVQVDHKTAGKAWDVSKHKPRKNNQASLYTELARIVWPEAPGFRFVFDVICYPNTKGEIKFERRISDPDSEHGHAVIKKAADLVDLWKAASELGIDLPANPASTLCNPKWCDFFEGCPHGAALDT